MKNNSTKNRVGNFNQSIGDITKYFLTDTGLLLNTNDESIEIIVFSNHIIRVRIYKNEYKQEDFSYAVTGKPENTDFQVIEEQGHLILQTKALKAVFSLTPFRVAFYTIDDKLINQDDTAFGTSWIGHEVTTYKKLHDDEKFIGLGEKNGPLNKRGKAYVNWNTDKFAYSVEDDPIYLSTPFYIGLHNNLAYGIFFDNTHKSTFNFGASNNRFIYFQAEDGEMNYYFIYHNHVSDIISSYTALTGRMELPPLWSLGFHQCRYSYYPDKEVMNVARTFREKNIPADVLYLDIHYMDNFKVFTWNKQTFPNPDKLCKDLSDLKFNLTLILDPGIKTQKGYKPYDEARSNNLLVKYPDGTPYEGQVWPGWSSFPDFTDEATRTWWADNIKALTEVGVTGFWNDMNEPATWGQHVPNLIEFNYEGYGATHKKAHNIYGMQMTRSTYQGARKYLNSQRPFILTRAGYSGVQRYSAVWTGDNVADNQHMMAGIRLINSMGLTGIAFAGYDVGGFAGNTTPDLYARWIMIGAFSPFFRAHSMINTQDSEPWCFGEEVEETARNFISLRYKLAPYLYASFYETTQTGLPVSRSLAIDYSYDENIYKAEYQHQYLFGKNILVAPVESTKDLSKVYLPQGYWFDLFTDTFMEGENSIIVETPLTHFPLYVKAGAVIPMQSLTMSLKEKPEDILFLHVWANANGSFTYYEDDGKSFEYLEGNYCKREIINDFKNKTITLDKQQGVFKSYFKEIKLYLHGFNHLLKEQVIVNGESVKVEFEDYKYIEPISDFDPFIDASKQILKIKNLAYISIKNRIEEINILWNN